MKIETIKIDKIIPYARNARTHSPEQVAQIAASIREWRKIGDYLVSRCGVIIALPVEHPNQWGGTQIRPAKVLAQSNDIDGYKLTTMRRLNKRTKPMRVWNGSEEKIMYGCEDLRRHGFRPQSMHAVANGYRKSCHGWSAEYIKS